MMNQCLMLFFPEYFHYPPSFQPKNFTFAALDIRRERKPKCVPQLFLESLLETRRSAIKVMLHATICNDDFQHNTALQHCCDIVLNSYNIVPTFQRCTVKHHTLRSNNGDVHGNVSEKQTASFHFFSSRLSQVAQLLKKKGIQVGTEERTPRPSSDRNGKIYRLAVPVLK